VCDVDGQTPAGITSLANNDAQSTGNSSASTSSAQGATYTPAAALSIFVTIASFLVIAA
jgi:hypothetical protein